jgi:PKD repeat protein
MGRGGAGRRDDGAATQPLSGTGFSRAQFGRHGVPLVVYRTLRNPKWAPVASIGLVVLLLAASVAHVQPAWEPPAVTRDDAGEGARPPVPPDADPAPEPTEAEREATRLAGAARFEANRGQAPASALFVAYTANGMVLLERDGLVVPVVDGAEPLRIGFAASTDVTVVGVDPLPGRSHIYTGNDASAWLRDIPQYAAVQYQGLHDGVDLVVYATPDGELEFDHIVAPGADWRLAQLRFSGHSSLQVEDEQLVVEAAGQRVQLAAPVAYQPARDEAGLLPLQRGSAPAARTPVAAAFEVLDAQRVGYRIGTYDAWRPLIIDPVLKYGSHIGTSVYEYGYGVAVHERSATERIIYVGGMTSSSTFPVGYPSTKRVGPTSGYDGFVARYHYDMTTHAMTPEWLVRIGGTSTDYIRDLDVDDAGNVIFGGYSQSTNFPVRNPIRVYSGPSLIYDGSAGAFWVYSGVMGRLDATGDLEFGSYFGGSSTDYLYAVAWDATNDRIVAGGQTFSSNLPMVGALDAVYSGSDGWVVSVTPQAPYSSVAFSTYLGGSSTEYLYDIAVDATGIYVAGSSWSTDYPTTPGAYRTTKAGSYDVVVTALRHDGSGYLYSTYIGTTGSEMAYGIDTNGAGRTWITGYTSSPGSYPQCPASCPGGAPPAFGTSSWGYDAFVSSLDPAGSTYLYGSLFGGTSTDYGRDISLNGRGQIAIVGLAYSSSLPFPASATVPTFPGGSNAFVVRFDTGTGIVDYGSWLGGSSSEDVYGIDSDNYVNSFIVGHTYSTNYAPISWNAVQPTSAGWYDAFFVAIGKNTPNPIIRARAATYPDAISPTSVMNILTYTDVVVDGTLSTAGSFPIDASKTRWEVYDASNVLLGTVVGTLTPTTGPGWPRLNLTDDGILKVCLKMYDTDPDPTDRLGVSCMVLNYLNRPPVPAITYVSSDPLQSTKLGTFKGTAFDIDGTVVEYRWTFGTYGTRYGANVTFTFPYGSEMVHTITLTAKDDDGVTSSATYKLKVDDGPLADFSWPAGTYLPDEPIVFKDLSKPGKDPLRPIWYWSWDWGDGSPVELYQLLGDRHPAPTVPHAYSKEGWYTVTLTVEDRLYPSSVTKSIYVSPRKPMAVGESFHTYFEVDLEQDAPGLLANEVHPMGYPLRVTGVSAPSKGSLTWNTDGSFVYKPPPGFLGNATFTYRVTDGLVTVGPVTATIHVSDLPPPVADFEPEVRGHAVVFKDTSTAGHYPVSAWLWDFGDGTTATLQHPVHAYGAVGTYAVTLTVFDATPAPKGPLASSTVRTVFIAADPTHAEPGSDKPVADAGHDLAARPGDSLSLDGSGSATPLYEVEYLWRQVSGPPVILVGGSTARPTFVAPPVPVGEAFVDLVFELIVHDGVQYSEPNLVKVRVHGVNQPPVAKVDPILQTATTGREVVLDAASSFDPEDDALSFRWEQMQGPEVEARWDGPQLRFVAPVAGENLLFRVVVSDGVQEVPALAEVRVAPASGGPRAGFTVDEGLLFQGIARFADTSSGDGLSYWWDFGDGSLPSHVASPEHRFGEDGTYRVSLVVTDEQGHEDEMARFVEVVLAAPTVPERAGAPGAADAEEAVPAEAESGAAAKAVPGIGVLALLAIALLARRRSGRNP